MQNSIRRQMKTAFTLLTLIPILIISFVLAGLNFQNRQTQVQELQSETAQRIALNCSRSKMTWINCRFQHT